MTNIEIISQGAEAKIYLIDNKYIIKKRFAKKYRNEVLDKKILKSRTKSEIKIMQELYNANIKVPKIIEYDLEEYEIKMEYIQEDTIKSNLNSKNIKKLAKIISKIHNLNICHGDITLKNILYSRKLDEITVIDFGLSYKCKKIDDFATDLFVLKETMNAEFDEKYFQEFILEYEKNIEKKEIVKHIEKIEKRRRNANT